MKFKLLFLIVFGHLMQSLPAQANESDLGKELYQVYCSQCHGIEGDGYGINVEDMEVLPKDHTDIDEMKNRTDEDLFKAIKYGGAAVDKSVLMPNWDANLTDKQINTLVSYLRVLCCQKTEK